MWARPWPDAHRQAEAPNRSEKAITTTFATYRFRIYTIASLQSTEYPVIILVSPAATKKVGYPRDGDSFKVAIRT